MLPGTARAEDEEDLEGAAQGKAGGGSFSGIDTIDGQKSASAQRLA